MAAREQPSPSPSLVSAFFSRLRGSSSPSKSRKPAHRHYDPALLSFSPALVPPPPPLQPASTGISASHAAAMRLDRFHRAWSSVMAAAHHAAQADRGKDPPLSTVRDPLRALVSVLRDEIATAPAMHRPGSAAYLGPCHAHLAAHSDMLATLMDVAAADQPLGFYGSATLALAALLLAWPPRIVAEVGAHRAITRAFGAAAARLGRLGEVYGSDVTALAFAVADQADRGADELVHLFIRDRTGWGVVAADGPPQRPTRHVRSESWASSRPSTPPLVHTSSHRHLDSSYISANSGTTWQTNGGARRRTPSSPLPLQKPPHSRATSAASSLSSMACATEPDLSMPLLPVLVAALGRAGSPDAILAQHTLLVLYARAAGPLRPLLAAPDAVHGIGATLAAHWALAVDPPVTASSPDAAAPLLATAAWAARAAAMCPAPSVVAALLAGVRTAFLVPVAAPMVCAGGRAGGRARVLAARMVRAAHEAGAAAVLASNPPTSSSSGAASLPGSDPGPLATMLAEWATGADDAAVGDPALSVAAGVAWLAAAEDAIEERSSHFHNDPLGAAAADNDTVEDVDAIASGMERLQASGLARASGSLGASMFSLVSAGNGTGVDVSLPFADIAMPDWPQQQQQQQQERRSSNSSSTSPQSSRGAVLSTLIDAVASIAVAAVEPSHYDSHDRAAALAAGHLVLALIETVSTVTLPHFFPTLWRSSPLIPSLYPLGTTTPGASLFDLVAFGQFSSGSTMPVVHPATAGLRLATAWTDMMLGRHDESPAAAATTSLAALQRLAARLEQTCSILQLPLRTVGPPSKQSVSRKPSMLALLFARSSELAPAITPPPPLETDQLWTALGPRLADADVAVTKHAWHASPIQRSSVKLSDKHPSLPPSPEPTLDLDENSTPLAPSPRIPTTNDALLVAMLSALRVWPRLSTVDLTLVAALVVATSARLPAVASVLALTEVTADALEHGCLTVLDSDKHGDARASPTTTSGCDDQRRIALEFALQMAANVAAQVARNGCIQQSSLH
ncbi:hypothetical protein BC828DRAFT_384780 [Blastocladiella britannica]|nr:hypothetical protein BC828DRAFT_384780 [Blastocladiella britannica]